MKIIKLAESNDKTKYEVYNVSLKEKQARKYREEQIKKLKFYRLIAHSVENVDDWERKINATSQKIIYSRPHRRPILISNNEVNYNDKIKYSSFSKGIKLYPYTVDSEFSLEDSQIQKKIIEQYIENCFKYYSLDSHYASNYSYYLFPKLFETDEKYCNNGFCDNVVVLSNEMAAMYFLQQLNNNDYWIYEQCLSDIISEINLENRDSFMENLQFTKEATIPLKAMNALKEMGLVEDSLERKIYYDRVYTPYLKK